MRILYYNWVDAYDPEGRGGGVSLYQRGLLEVLGARPGVEVTFLSAGLAHGIRPGPPRWERVDVPDAGRKGRGSGATAGGASARRFRLVDTLPVSPSHHSFGAPEQLSHPPTEDAFARFVAAEGPFDAIHFNNLEGLPAAVLALRARWPETRMLVALHNYYPFCPQVNLWWRERAHCTDFHDGAACVTCLPVRRAPDQVRRLHAMTGALERVGLGPGTVLHDRAVRPTLEAAKGALRRRMDRQRGRLTDTAAPPAIGAAEDYALRRAGMVALLNTHADRVLAVSERTAEIALGFGVDPARLAVHPIGTDQAEHWNRTPPPARLPRADGTLGLGFLGYMRPDKGFPFLLAALERMPPGLLSRLRLTVAAESRGDGLRERLRALAPRLAGLRHLEGYAREELGTVLDGVDLGVVPGLWEDNLPQVALEMHARRVPLLTSDRGGAHELGACPALVFRAGDAADLEQRLATILDSGLDLGPYWAGARPPLDPEAHADTLMDLYRGLMTQDPEPPRPRIERPA